MSTTQRKPLAPEQASGSDVVVDAQKCLSAVARLQGEWGLYMVADVLRGSEKKRVLENGLDELSVYGLLDTLTRAKIVAMLEALLDTGLICRGAHDCLGLTPLGTAVMLAKRELPTALEDALMQAKEASSKRAPADRYESDSWTLTQTLYGLRGGHSPHAIAQFRDLAESTICEHMMCLAARGESFDLTPHLHQDLLEELREKAANWQPGDPVSTVRDALDEEECDWTTLKLHLLQVFQE